MGNKELKLTHLRISSPFRGIPRPRGFSPGILVMISLACSTMRSEYPSHWWTPVPPSEAQWWEVLPQAAAPGEVILSKRNELGLLSNFAHTPFEFRGRRYQSIEGLWQMMLFPEGPDDPRAQFPGLT